MEVTANSSIVALSEKAGKVTLSVVSFDLCCFNHFLRRVGAGVRCLRLFICFMGACVFDSHLFFAGGKPGAPALLVRKFISLQRMKQYKNTVVRRGLLQKSLLF